MAEMTPQIWDVRGADAYSKFTGVKRHEGESDVRGGAGDSQVYTDKGGCAPPFLSPSPLAAAPLVGPLASSGGAHCSSLLAVWRLEPHRTHEDIVRARHVP